MTTLKTPGRAPVPKDAPAISPQVNILNQIDQPGGAAEIGQLLEKTRKHYPKATLFSEAMVNLVGYDHIQSGDTKRAVEIMKLNVAAYPNSPNAYDSFPMLISRMARKIWRGRTQRGDWNSCPLTRPTTSSAVMEFGPVPNKN